MKIGANEFYEKFLKPMGAPSNCKKAVITVEVDEPVMIELTLFAIVDENGEKTLVEEIKRYRMELCDPDDSTGK
jgi:hypothetical protein